MRKRIVFPLCILVTISITGCSSDKKYDYYDETTTTTEYKYSYNYDKYDYDYNYNYDTYSYKEDLFSYLSFSDKTIKSSGHTYKVYSNVKNTSYNKTLSGYVKAVIYNGSQMECTALLSLPSLKPGDTAVIEAYLPSEFSGKYTKIDIQDSVVVDW